MATTPFKIAKGELGLSLTASPAGTVEDDTIANYTAFSCEITSALISATSNFDTEPVPGTFCDPESETVTPRAATFELQIGALQRPDDVASLQKFLWDNDSGVSGTPAYFYVALADGAAPKARGLCYLSPMDFGGEPRVVLSVDGLSLPIEGRPELEFGTTADV